MLQDLQNKITDTVKGVPQNVMNCVSANMFRRVDLCLLKQHCSEF